MATGETKAKKVLKVIGGMLFGSALIGTSIVLGNQGKEITKDAMNYAASLYKEIKNK